MGTSLGYAMVASPNHVWAMGHPGKTDALLISAAGPMITILIGVIGFLLVQRRASLFGFALLYMAFFSRFLAGAVSFFNANDEARISAQLGLGSWTLPLVVAGVLFVLTWLASRRLKLSFRDQLLCYVVASVAVSIVVGVDQLFFSKP